MVIGISVVICTHNPRSDYLARVLEALRNQTLPASEWELLVIDNASKELVAPRFDISWHPNGLHLHEPTLGKTAALLLGISRATGELLVTVDDDNVLDLDYFERTAEIAQNYPFLGAWGSGMIQPEFEVEPPAWAKPHLDMLALFELERDVWSNLINNNATVPCGAGQVVRSHVARTYATYCKKSALRFGLDRKGNSLVSGGDKDLALTACDLGLGTGMFRSLRLSHLIPSNRLQLDYLVRMKEDMAFSQVISQFVRGGSGVAQSPKGIGKRMLMAYHRLRLPHEERALYDAQVRGKDRAFRVISGHGPINAEKASTGEES
jgi:glycosyltransferase involved in cell wall biosynthesis